MEELGEDWLSPQGADLLRLEAGKERDLNTYLDRLTRRYHSVGLAKYLSEMAAVIQPYDSVLGFDEENPTARAFYRGALLGLRLVHEFMPTVLRSRLFEVKLIGDNNEDPIHNHYLVASNILASGGRGYELAEAYHGLFEDWEDQLSPEVNCQQFSRHGFGVVIFMMHEAWYLHTTSQIQQALNPGFDWDGQLEAFLNSPDDQ